MRRALVIASIAAGAIVAPAHAADPIEGTWSYRGGLVEVRAAAGGFTGIVRRELRFAACPHRVGERMWRIFKGRGYSGRHLSFDDRIPGCSGAARVWLRSSFHVSGNVLRVRIARFTGTSPGPCGAATVCFTLRRASPRVSTTTIAIGVDARAASGGEALGTTYLRSSVSAHVDVERRGRRTAVRGSVDLVHDDAVGGSKVVHLEVMGIVRSTLRVRVKRSEIAGCEAGARGTLQFDDGRPDAVQLRACGWNLVFRGDAPDSRVDVTVRGSSSGR